MKKIFKDKKVVVMGLGLNGGGVGVAKFFCRQGASVLVADLQTKEQLQKSIDELKNFKVEFALGGHRDEDFIDVDLIIKNPAVPHDSRYLKIAKEHKVLVKSDIEIFFELCKAPIIGITGTKGKTTTATLIYLFLKTTYPKTILAGNMGISPLGILSKINKGSKVVLELSSFELEDLQKSPDIAVITSFFPDHLNRYKTFDDYVEAKKIIFKHQVKDNYLILNLDDPKVAELAQEATARVRFFSKNKPFAPIIPKEGLKIFGDQNISNISAAIEVAKIFRISQKNIRKILLNFKGVKNRQEFVAEKRGVKYFNDTAATNPDSAIFGIKTFKQRFPAANLILIAGGVDKNLNYTDLASEIKNNVGCLVLLPGNVSDILKKEISFLLYRNLKVIPVNSMQEAVSVAAKEAEQGDIVLLSPASASFNLFKNEFDRGDRFVEAVNKL